MNFEWIQQNAIAIYGAIVGTIALFLNLGRFLLMYQKSIRKLKVESTIDSRAQELINDAINPRSIFGTGSERERDPNSLIGPIYTVTVRNVSHVDMHIHDVGLIINEQGTKNKKPALIRGRHFLQDLASSGGDDISAGASKTYNIWLKAEVEIPDICGCYVVDKLNKEYSGKHHSNNIALQVPEKA